MFALAGLYEHWVDKSSRSIDSCTIIVGEANNDVIPIHHRMPIILEPEDFNRWLDPEIQSEQILKPLLKKRLEGTIKHYPVSPKVNNPKNDSADLIEPRFRNPK